MESGVSVSPLVLLAPVAILLVGATLLAVLPRLGTYSVTSLRTIAFLVILLVLVRVQRLSDAYAPLVSIPLGHLTIPIMDLGVDPHSLSWVRLLLVGSLASSLLLPAPSLSSCLLLLAITSTTFLANSFATVVLAWCFTEAGLFFIGAENGNQNAKAIPFTLGTIALVVALYGSAFEQAFVFSEASFKPLSWLLLIIAVGLRLRLWPLHWAENSLPKSVFIFLVVTTTGFLVLSRGTPASPDELPPWWLGAALGASAVVASLLAWLHKQNELELPLMAGAALAPLLILLATLSTPLSPALGPAAIHLTAAIVVYALAPGVPAPSQAPRWLAQVIPLLAILTLAPLPIFPFGRAVTQVFSLLGTIKPISAIVAAMVLALPLAAMASTVLEKPDRRPVLHWRDGSDWALAITLAATLLPGLGLAPTFISEQGNKQQLSGLAGGSAALSTLVILALVWADRRSLLPRSDLQQFPRARVPVLSRLGSFASAATMALETVFRLVEGETALTWATLIGFAILIIATGG